eukprot:TRINITY_DN60128_c0_g1_i1.p1 TRINITY_DN60128_c0_g1~~TRINITY_DN60128_c0_g1_i1.p1  ORF type:complete len:817 (+),score=248.72 TRINITY_DN60128_c0_g1_i1:104-2452(+)
MALLWCAVSEGPLHAGGGSPQERACAAHGEAVLRWAEWAALAHARPQYPPPNPSEDSGEPWAWLCADVAAGLQGQEEQEQRAVTAELVARLLPQGWQAVSCGSAAADMAADPAHAEVAVFPPIGSAAARAPPGSEQRRMHAFAIRQSLSRVLPVGEGELWLSMSGAEPAVELCAAPAHAEADPRLASCLLLPAKVSQREAEAAARQLRANGRAARQLCTAGGSRLLAFDTPMDAAAALQTAAAKSLGAELRLAALPFPLTAQQVLIGFADNVASFSVPLRSAVLLRSYLLAAGPAARLFAAVVQRWGERHGVTDAAQGFLSPYCLALLAAHYLLRATGAPYVDPGAADPGNAATPLPAPSPGDVQAAAQLTRGFFAYYAAFPWDHEAVALHSPVPVSRAETGWSEEVCRSTLASPQVEYHEHMEMCIVCPTTGCNVAQRVTAPRASFIRGLMVLSHALLSHPRPGAPLPARLASLFSAQSDMPSRMHYNASASEFIGLVDPRAAPLPPSALPVVVEVPLPASGTDLTPMDFMVGMHPQGAAPAVEPTRVNGIDTGFGGQFSAAKAQPPGAQHADSRLSPPMHEGMQVGECFASPDPQLVAMRGSPRQCRSPSYATSHLRTAQGGTTRRSVQEAFLSHAMWDTDSPVSGGPSASPSPQQGAQDPRGLQRAPPSLQPCTAPPPRVLFMPNQAGDAPPRVEAVSQQQDVDKLVVELLRADGDLLRDPVCAPSCAAESLITESRLGAAMAEPSCASPPVGCTPPSPRKLCMMLNQFFGPQASESAG